MEKAKMLVLVDPVTNRNATFSMRVEGSMIVTQFSRTQGGRPISTKYPFSSKTWDQLVKKHLKKGFTDLSDMGAKAESVSFKEIADKAVREFVDFITTYSRKLLKDNYQEVRFTMALIERAQELLDKASKADSVEEFNRYIVEVLKLIPRRMDNVADYLAKDRSDMGRILDREDGLLRAAMAEVRYQKAGPDKTLPEALGIAIRTCTDAERDNILSHMEPQVRSRCGKAFRINNKKTDAAFQKKMEKGGYTSRDIHYLYHGTGRENLLGIITEGPKLHPDARITAKMFGFGFYTADKVEKSLRYMGVRMAGKVYNKDHNDKGYLLIYKVLFKDPLHVYRHRHEMCSYTQKSIAPHDALFAHAGQDLFNNEYIVYEVDRVTLQYAIEIR